jgi:hydroxymethylpyrimidine/phosphomethylpyrimidine kinase
VDVLRLLSVAGSDSGGGAGIQADVKVFAFLAAHGMTAVTALTAQNTRGVEAVHELPPAFVRAQIRAVVGDIGVDAVKVGMLANAAVVEVVADELAALARPLVVDPVMVATSGARLLDEDAVAVLRERLVPLASVVTPNLAEARVLVDQPSLGAREAACALHALGAHAAVVTGGDEDGIDWFCDESGPRPIEGPLHPSAATHGSGCTHSAALAVYLAQGRAPFEASLRARRFAARAVEFGLRDLGAGIGPVNVGAGLGWR